MPSRRNFHRLCFANFIATWAGCTKQPGNQSSGSQSSGGQSLGSQSGAPGSLQASSKVPLRLWMAGSAADADAIRRGWASVSSQEVDITLMPFERPSGRQAPADLADAPDHRSDVVLGPSILLADWIAAKAIVPLADEATTRRVNTMLPAVRSGLCRYAGKHYCLPLAAPMPSLISAEPIDGCDDWAAYDRQVQKWDGQAAEPTAPGWAAMTFLWRAASQVDRWLFDSNSFDSLIAGQPYVKVLQQMKRTCDRYRGRPSTPRQVASQVQSGQLRGGIGFPANSESTAMSSLSFQPTPRGTGTTAILLDPMSPVVALSANCRQTAASKTFMLWITGGEGSDLTRNQIASGFPLTRSAQAANSAAMTSAPIASSPYLNLLRSELSGPVVQTGLLIRQGQRYYAALDQAVLDCLTGQTTAAQSLASASRQWNQFTQNIGVAAQNKAWRRAKGFSA